MALAALSVGDASTSTLYGINLATGAAALPTGVANGTIGGGERVRALTLRAAPTVTAYGLTNDQKLVAFSPSQPSAILRSVAVTGLQSDESLLA